MADPVTESAACCASTSSWVVRGADAHSAGRLGSDRRCLARSLLKHMGHFVRQQISSIGRGRRILAGGEVDVPADGVGVGTESIGGTYRSGVGMYTYFRQVGSEARLHEFTRGGDQWVRPCLKTGSWQNPQSHYAWPNLLPGAA